MREFLEKTNNTGVEFESTQNLWRIRKQNLFSSKHPLKKIKLEYFLLFLTILRKFCRIFLKENVKNNFTNKNKDLID